MPNIHVFPTTEAAAEVLHRIRALRAPRLGALAGTTFVRHGDRLERTADEDDGVMVLRFGPSAAVDLCSPISCEARAGDDW